MRANDAVDPSPVTPCHCGTCRHWGEVVPSRRLSVVFGQCWVARGPLPIYMAANAACSIRSAGQVMWAPVAPPKVPA